MKKFLAGLVAVSLLGCISFAAMAEENLPAENQEVVAATENTEEKTDENAEDKKEEVSEEKVEDNKEEENKEVSPDPGSENGAETPKNELSVEVNGKEVVFPDAKPFIDENDRTLIPLRAIGEALNLKVEWDGTARKASFIGEGKSVIFTIDQTEYEIVTGEESEKAQMDTKAVISEDRTYAPVRYLAEAFGFAVEWNQDTKTVIIKENTPAGDLPEVKPEEKTEENNENTGEEPKTEEKLPENSGTDTSKEVNA